MLILYETPGMLPPRVRSICWLTLLAGFALFQVKDEGKLKDVDKLFTYFESVDKAKKLYACPCLIALNFYQGFTKGIQEIL